MSTMIQIRNVPDDLHRELKSRAAREGMSMSDWLLRELRKSLERPSRGDLLERVSGRSSVAASPAPDEAVREERESR